MAERHSTGRAEERHGESGRRLTPEYRAYRHMIDRCCAPGTKQYHDYGGRGITVCERWRASYLAFLADVGRRPTPKHTIGRIDNDGHYCPENCEWQTREQQASNRRSNRFVTHDGVTLTIAQWAKKLGIDRSTLHWRLGRSGWPVERALTTFGDSRNT